MAPASLVGPILSSAAVCFPPLHLAQGPSCTAFPSASIPTNLELFSVIP